MKKNFIMQAAAAFLASSAFADTIPLVSGWYFHKGALPPIPFEISAAGRWQKVDVPHDWAISGPFDREIDKQVVAIVQNGEKEATEKTGRSGSLPWIGEGWYVRDVAIPSGAKQASLVFEGAMSEAHVYWDGCEIAFWPYGYNMFEVALPLSGDEPAGKKHSLAVHLANVAESSRWYPGAGIYRPVYLVTGGEVSIRHCGQDVKTELEADGSACVTVTTELSGDASDATVLYALCSSNSVVAAAVAPAEKGRASAVLKVGKPHLWSPESPVLYNLHTEVRRGSATLETREQLVGLRTVSVGPDGFKLNGVVRKIKGVCLHHDLGPLGAAFDEAAFRRQLRKLAGIGCDAVRFSHNMPCSGQLAICDEMGFMVMAESFDCWEYPKCKNGYNRFFKDWWRKDLANLVKICRAHPSVVMYSIGNEIPEQTSERGLALSREMQDFMHSLDSSIPVTQGLDRWPGCIKSGVAGVMDVTGLNYRLKYYGEARKAAKINAVLGSETTSTVSSRGCYYFPVKTMLVSTPHHADGQCTGYDVECASWSNLPDDDRAMQEDNDWVMGEFVWTGFDYLGEPSPYDEYWPSRSSYFGIFDLAGLPKDRAWLYRSMWKKDAKTVHIVPHWTWPGREGETTPVYVYTSAESAELFVNGKSQGVRTKDKSSRLDRYRLRWNDVVYEPGELRVVTCDGLESTVRTALEPAAIRITEEPHDERDGLRFFDVAIVDSNGTLCPSAALPLEVEITGAAEFKGICNGDATSLEVFTEPRMKTFAGELVVVAKATGKGPAAITVKETGLDARKGGAPLPVGRLAFTVE